MLSFFLFALTIVAAVANGQALLINTPCQPVQLSWANGKAPFYVSVIPAGQPAAPPLAKFPPQNATALTWVVNLRAGSNVGLKITDGIGATAYTSPVVVQEGFDDKCLTEGVNVTAPGGGQPGGQTTPAPTNGAGQTEQPGQTGQTGQPQQTGDQQTGQTASPSPSPSPTPGQQGNATQTPHPSPSPPAHNSTAKSLTANGLVVAVALIAAAM